MADAPFERRAFFVGGPFGVDGDDGEDFAAARCMNYSRVSRFLVNAQAQQLTFIPISPLDIVLGVFPDMVVVF